MFTNLNTIDNKKNIYTLEHLFTPKSLINVDFVDKQNASVETTNECIF